MAAAYRGGGPAGAPPLHQSPEPDGEEQELRNLETRADRAAIEQAVEAQLELLKRKMGK